MHLHNESNKINKTIETTLKNLGSLIDVNTVIGKPLKTDDGECVIPISKVKYSFISGGLDQQAPKPYVDGDYPFGGGAGGMTSITPVAFLVYVNNDVKLLHLEEASHSLETLVDAIPNAVTKIMNVMNNKKNLV